VGALDEKGVPMPFRGGAKVLLLPHKRSAQIEIENGEKERDDILTFDVSQSM
jgi:hypothetical protein